MGNMGGFKETRFIVMPVDRHVYVFDHAILVIQLFKQPFIVVS